MRIRLVGTCLLRDTCPYTELYDWVSTLRVCSQEEDKEESLAAQFESKLAACGQFQLNRLPRDKRYNENLFVYAMSLGKLKLADLLLARFGGAWAELVSGKMPKLTLDACIKLVNATWFEAAEQSKLTIIEKLICARPDCLNWILPPSLEKAVKEARERESKESKALAEFRGEGAITGGTGNKRKRGLTGNKRKRQPTPNTNSQVAEETPIGTGTATETSSGTGSATATETSSGTKTGTGASGTDRGNRTPRETRGTLGTPLCRTLRALSKTLACQKTYKGTAIVALTRLLIQHGAKASPVPLRFQKLPWVAHELGLQTQLVSILATAEPFALLPVLECVQLVQSYASHPFGALFVVPPPEAAGVAPCDVRKKRDNKEIVVLLDILSDLNRISGEDKRCMENWLINHPQKSRRRK